MRRSPSERSTASARCSTLRPQTADFDPERVRDVSYFHSPTKPSLRFCPRMPTDSEDEIAAAAASLVAKGMEAVVVTLGGRGAQSGDSARDRAHPRRFRWTPSTRPARATRSSAASRVITPPAPTSRPRSKEHRDTQQIP